jgi:exodeoxyribonuclease VII large subunit
LYFFGGELVYFMIKKKEGLLQQCFPQSQPIAYNALCPDDSEKTINTQMMNKNIVKKIWTISEISQLLRDTIESRFFSVEVQGEISGLKMHSSGHIYLSLKDQGSVLDAIIWKNTAEKISNTFFDGQSVTAQGKITIYGGRSKYQMIILSLQISGRGLLLKNLEELKEKLTQEGLFDPQLKKKITSFPAQVGIMTSATGAVFHDICHRLEERFPCVKIFFYAVATQGASCVQENIAGLAFFQKQYPTLDALIIARGGGSIEDLWFFNDESLIRAAFQCSIPIVSAIGHETDSTLLDDVADLCAPTPTAAAEMITPLKSELIQSLQDFAQRMIRLSQNFLNQLSLQKVSAAKGVYHPQVLIQHHEKTVHDLLKRLLLKSKQSATFYDNQLQQQKNIFVKIQKNFLLSLHHKQQIILQNIKQIARLSEFFYEKNLELYRYHADKLDQSSYQSKLKQGFTSIFLDKQARQSVHWHSVEKKTKAFLFFYQGHAEITIDSVHLDKTKF